MHVYSRITHQLQNFITKTTTQFRFEIKPFECRRIGPIDHVKNFLNIYTQQSSLTGWGHSTWMYECALKAITSKPASDIIYFIQLATLSEERPLKVFFVALNKGSGSDFVQGQTVLLLFSYSGMQATTHIFFVPNLQYLTVLLEQPFWVFDRPGKWKTMLSFLVAINLRPNLEISDSLLRWI